MNHLRITDEVILNAYFVKKKPLILHACKTIVGDSQNNIRNVKNGIIVAP